MLDKKGNLLNYSDCISLIKKDDHEKFLMDIKKKTNLHIEFDVYEVVGWIGRNPDEINLYLSGTLRWDGVSHIWFGEENEVGNADGYINLSGKMDFELHCQMMLELYNYCKKQILRYDASLAED